MNCSAFQIKTFKAYDGAEIHYVDVGSGQPMIYVCGFGSTIASQAPFIDAMRSRGRIIVLDQRAFGTTPAAGEMGVHQSARDVRALMEALELPPVVLYGYSMGAAVTFSYISQFGTAGLSKIILGDMSPKLINEGDWALGLYQGHYTRSMYEKDLELIRTDYKRFALIVAEGLLFQNSPQHARNFTGTADDIRARILNKRNDPIAQGLIQGMVYITEEHMAANYEYWSTMAGSDFRTVLPEIDVPALILYADPGSAYSPATAAYMKSQLPNAALMPIYGCTHMAASENPMQWRGCIAAFAYS